MKATTQEILSRFNRVDSIVSGVLSEHRTTIVLHDEFYQAKAHFYRTIQGLIDAKFEPTSNLSELTIKLNCHGERIIKFTSRNRIEPLAGYERGSAIVICDADLSPLE